MFTSILVPVSNGNSTKHATKFGCRLAKHYDARIEVLHASEEKPRDSVENGDPKEHEILDEIAGLVSEADVVVDTHLVEGQPHKSIPEHVDENNIDLVVMARRQRSGLGERLLGTVTDRVLRRTSTPVLTVPTGATEDITDVTYENVLVPTDGSKNAERAAPYGANVAEQVDASLHLLSVVDVQAEAGAFNAGGVTDEFVERLETEGRTAVERLEQHIDDTDVSVESSVVRGTSHDAVSEYVAENSIDLVVMASKGKSSFASRPLGSVTERVLRTVNVPVLVVVS